MDELDLLNISLRERNCLRAAGIITIAGLRVLKKNDLLSIPNIGHKSVGEIGWALYEHIKSQSPPPQPQTPIGPKTLRDEFALAAMVFELNRNTNVLQDPDCYFDSWDHVQEYCASYAYGMADKMMGARNGTTPD
mgnify:FL=1